MRAFVGVTALLVAMGGVAWADASFEIGDVMASTSGGHYQQWRKVAGVWTLMDTLDTGAGGFTTGSAFDADGNFYGTNFSNDNVSKFTGPGTPHTHSIFLSNDSGGHNESILFDLSGNIYIGQPDGTHDILKYDSAGNFIARFDVSISGRGTDWIDLAADQTTMYYAGEGRVISRYDVGTDTQLTDFATLAGSGNAYALRLLGDGGLLIADSNEVKRLDSTGTVIDTYDVDGVDGFFALNLDPDGDTFWTGSFNNDHLYRFNIATGELIDEIDTGGGGGTLFGVSVNGEITEGGGGGHVVPLPAAAWMGLTVLAGMGAIRRRRGRNLA